MTDAPPDALGTVEPPTPAEASTRPQTRRSRDFGHGRCKLCGDRFKRLYYNQEFCVDDHKYSFWKIARVRGGTVYPLLLEWRKTRKIKGGRKGYLSDIAHIVDQWIIEDREKGKR